MLQPIQKLVDNLGWRRVRDLFVCGPEDHSAFHNTAVDYQNRAHGRWKMSPFSVDQIPKQTKNSPIQTFLSEFMMHEENAAKFFEGAEAERREMSNALFGMRYGARAERALRAGGGLVVKMADTSQGASNVMAKLAENATQKPRIPVLMGGDLLDGRPMRTSDELLGGGILKGDWLKGGVPLGVIPYFGTPSRFSGYFYKQVLERLKREGKDIAHICLEDPDPLAGLEADITADALERFHKYLGNPMPVVEMEIEAGIGKTAALWDSYSHFPTRIDRLFYKDVPALYEKERKKHKHEAAVRRVVKQAKRQGPCDAKRLALYLETVGAEYEQSKKEAR